MRFDQAHLLWLLLLAPLAACFFAWAAWRKSVVLRRFADAALLRRLVAGTSAARQILKMALLTAAIFFLALGLARPQWGAKTEVVKRKGLDVVVAVDVSLSMLAEDIKPNRLARSKQEILRFVDGLSGDRVGLVAFAGDAFLQCPLTSDYGAFRIFLDVLDPSLLNVPGTDIGRAVETGLRAFPPGERKYRVMVLLTDGEDHSGEAEKIAREAADQGVVIYTVGIGSPGGVPIPIEDGSGHKSYKTDAQGNVVSTRMDPQLLQDIAKITGGRFYQAAPGHFELLDVLKEINGMQKRELESQEVSRFEDHFQIPLGIALLLLAAEMIVSDRRRRKQAWSGRFL